MEGGAPPPPPDDPVSSAIAKLDHRSCRQLLLQLADQPEGRAVLLSEPGDRRRRHRAAEDEERVRKALPPARSGRRPPPIGSRSPLYHCPQRPRDLGLEDPDERLCSRIERDILSLSSAAGEVDAFALDQPPANAQLHQLRCLPTRLPLPVSQLRARCPLTPRRGTRRLSLAQLKCVNSLKIRVLQQENTRLWERAKCLVEWGRQTHPAMDVQWLPQQTLLHQERRMTMALSSDRDKLAAAGAAASTAATQMVHDLGRERELRLAVKSLTVHAANMDCPPP